MPFQHLLQKSLFCQSPNVSSDLRRGCPQVVEIRRLIKRNGVDNPVWLRLHREAVRQPVSFLNDVLSDFSICSSSLLLKVRCRQLNFLVMVLVGRLVKAQTAAVEGTSNGIQTYRLNASLVIAQI